MKNNVQHSTFNIQHFLLFIVHFSLFIVFVACDKIEPPFTENNNNPDTNNIQFQRRILLDDFTGFKCGHCPGGHKIVESLSKKYGNKLIAVGIHAGYYAIPDASGKYTYDFRTAEGDALDNLFNITPLGLPQGMINRKTYDISKAVPPAKWEEYIEEILSTQPKVDINLTPNFDSLTSKLNTLIRITALEDIDESLNLSVYIIENNIINYQLDYNSTPNTIPDYVHHNVLRTSINGTLGSALTSSKFNKDQIINKDYQYVLKAEWNSKQIYVVAFVYDADSYEVLQAEKVKILN